MPKQQRPKSPKVAEASKTSKDSLHPRGNQPGGSKSDPTTPPPAKRKSDLSPRRRPTRSSKAASPLASPPILSPGQDLPAQGPQPVSPIPYDVMSEPTAVLSRQQTAYSVRGLVSTSSFYAGGQRPWYRKLCPVVAAAAGIMLGILVVAAILVVRYQSSAEGTPTPNFLTCDDAFAEPRVHLESLGTTIHGNVTHVRTLRRFLGIPYARNVSGSQRFRLAQAVTGSDLGGVFYAHRHGPACPQASVNEQNPTEECLTLSIWAPVVCNASATPMVVLVVLASEWFDYGSLYEYEYIWESLALSGGLIVVTINHRLGIFGFLDSGNGDPAGDMGIQDAFMAVTWVADHIHAFHGDPKFLVGLGQGSGSYILSLDLFAEASGRKRHFKRLILDGLLPASLLPPSASLLAVATSFGCANTTHAISSVECLRNASVAEIQQKMPRSPPLIFTPSCRKLPGNLCEDTFNKLPATLIDTDILCAYSKSDGWKLFDRYLAGNEYLRNYSSLFHHMQQFFTGRTPRYSLEDLPEPARTWLNEADPQGLRDLVVAMVLRCPMVKLANTASGRGAVVYLYSSEGVENFLTSVATSDLIAFANNGKVRWDEFSSRRRFLFNNGTFRSTADWPEDWCELPSNLSKTVFT